ncbi:hypothetical protein E8E12_010971 [Didymella heteroderae]|uniref:DUF7918 domain-containing protein n=1 Tax=Didymella heteroderae TaxID=1769908 RepID=A0A9P4WWJ9_9PLEO|nr:hypothetical protein E8E12_010971 [Didymella heteroderae]
MAILAQVPGLKVEIVDRRYRPVNEYEDEGDGQSPEGQSPEGQEEQRTYEVTRYIESKSGAKFGIRRTFDETFSAEHGIRMDIRIDGCIARVMLDAPANLHEHDGQRVVSFQHEYKDSKRLRRDFQFAALEAGEMSDDEGLSNLPHNIQAVGTISVIFYKIKNVRCCPRTSPMMDSPLHKKIERMTEKSMKGDTRSHTFTLGEPREAKPKKSMWLYDFVDEEQYPFAKYHFKYRSLGE